MDIDPTTTKVTCGGVRMRGKMVSELTRWQLNFLWFDCHEIHQEAHRDTEIAVASLLYQPARELTLICTDCGKRQVVDPDWMRHNKERWAAGIKCPECKFGSVRCEGGGIPKPRKSKTDYVR